MAHGALRELETQVKVLSDHHHHCYYSLKSLL